MEEIKIQVDNLSKIYKLYAKPMDRLKETLSITHKKYHSDFYALKDISFSIHKGETVGIVGKNGSGKSTLLKLLTGVATSSTGILNVNGKVSALLELGAGFNSEYSGVDNIYLNGTIMGIPREEMEKRYDDIVKFADIGDYIYQPVKTYSSGMFVRLAFAVAVNVNPDILIIDEALAVGDTRFQLKCMDKFLEFKEKGISIIFVSHDVNAIKRFCDRTLWINNGELIADDDTDIVTDKYMDYLRMLDVEDGITHKNEGNKVTDSTEETSLEVCNSVDIAKIEKVTIFNEKGLNIENITHGEKIKIKVEYYVNDDTIQNPVLGLAILRVDALYICGVNTMLDKVSIPWEKGVNTFVLEYDSFDLVGGSYYFDVALYDKTATVAFDYQTKYKNFFVSMNYVAEGIMVLKHKWLVVEGE